MANTTKKGKIRAWLIWNICFTSIGVLTGLTLLTVANFPHPLRPADGVSLLQYQIESHHYGLLLATIIPLVIGLALNNFSKRKRFQMLGLMCLSIASFGYMFVIGTFNDIGREAQPWLEDAASILQPAFFIFILPLYVILRMIAIWPSKRIQNKDLPSWMKLIRNYLFPRFSEINYGVLFICAMLLSILNPHLIVEAIKINGKMIFIIGASIYLFIRVLSSKKLDHNAKLWIAMLYYGLLAFCSFFALFDQLENQVHQATFATSIDTWVIGYLMGISAVRLIITLIIFRVDDGVIGKILTVRFSDEQHSLWEFGIVAIISIIIMLYLRQIYEPGNSLFLLTFAYSSIAISILDKLRNYASGRFHHLNYMQREDQP